MAGNDIVVVEPVISYAATSLPSTVCTLNVPAASTCRVTDPVVGLGYIVMFEFPEWVSPGLPPPGRELVTVMVLVLKAGPQPLLTV